MIARRTSQKWRVRTSNRSYKYSFTKRGTYTALFENPFGDLNNTKSDLDSWKELQTSFHYSDCFGWNHQEAISITLPWSPHRLQTLFLLCWSSSHIFILHIFWITSSFWTSQRIDNSPIVYDSDKQAQFVSLDLVDGSCLGYRNTSKIGLHFAKLQNRKF